MQRAFEESCFPVVKECEFYKIVKQTKLKIVLFLSRNVETRPQFKMAQCLPMPNQISSKWMIANGQSSWLLLALSSANQAHTWRWSKGKCFSVCFNRSFIFNFPSLCIFKVTLKTVLPRAIWTPKLSSSGRN